MGVLPGGSGGRRTRSSKPEPGFAIADQRLRIEDYADGVRDEVGPCEVRVGLVHGGEVVDLSLDAPLLTFVGEMPPVAAC
jgi:hypothetical protein